MHLELPITTDEHRQLLAGETSSVVKLDSKYWNQRVKKGKEFQFDEITAVSKLGRIEMQPRVYWTTRDYPTGRRPVIVFRRKR